MNPPQDHKQGKPPNDELKAELAAARLALREERFYDVEQHVNRATQLGATTKQVYDLSNSARRGRDGQKTHIRSGRRWGFWCGILAYLLLSLQQPLGWTMPIWIFLAFLLAPGGIGIVVMLRLGAHTEGRVLFRAAGMAMAYYAAINLIILSTRLGETSESATGHLLAGTLTTLLFALAAGCVAGVVSLLLRSRPAKERTHEPAS